MINRIELENWKTHGSSRINFARGTNILIGQMGAGKSSVLDAISFALFGTFPSIQHRRVNVSELIRNRPEQKDHASVTLDFTLDGESYVVKRNISRNGGAKATLEKNGQYVQSQPQRVNEEIVKILKVDYDLFSKAIYSEQNGLDYFLNLRPTERKKQMDELLGLDKFALAQDNVTSVMNKIKDLADANEQTASGFDIEKLKVQLNSLNDELEKLEQEKRKMEKELGEITAKKTSHEKELAELKEQYQRKVKLEQEIASSKSKAEMLSKEIEKIEQMNVGDEKELNRLIEKAKKDLQSAKEDIKQMQEKWHKEQVSLSNSTAELNKLKKDRLERDKLVDEQKKSDKKALEEKIWKLKEDLDWHQRELAEHTALRNESSKWVRELDKHLQKCPVCERELDDEMRERLLGNKESSIKKLDQMIKEITAKTEKAKDENEKLTESLSRLKIIDEKLKSYGDPDSSIAKLEESVKKESVSVEKLKTLGDAANETLSKRNGELLELTSKMDAISRRARYIGQKDEIAKRLELTEKERNSIKADQSKLDDVQKKLTEIVSEASKLSANVTSYARYESDKKAQIKDKKIEIEKINALYEDVKKKRGVTENLMRFKVSLQETQAVLRTKLIDSINSIMQEVWPDLYPYGDYTSVMIDATAEDYVLKVKTKSGPTADGWQEVEAIASGGERSIACLAMRIAFSLVLSPNLRWLILDEPTHNIDQQGLERFIKMFNEVLPRIVDQIFIITHDPILKQAYNSKVYMLNRNKDEDRETVVEEV